jgi:hypothetical protein
MEDVLIPARRLVPVEENRRLHDELVLATHDRVLHLL